MTSLYDYLNESAHRDAYTEWGWQCNPPIPLLGRDDVGHWLHDELDYWQKKDPQRKPPILLPISAWYDRAPDKDHRIKKSPDEPDAQELCAQTLAASYGLHQNTSIKKLLHTDAYSNPGKKIPPPSWFASPESGSEAIHEGDHFVIVDDAVISGSTIRDLIKHINLRGGIVDAVVESVCESQRRWSSNVWSKEARTFHAERFAALVYAAEHQQHVQLKRIYNNTDTLGSRVTCMRDIQKTPDPFALLGIVGEQKMAALENGIACADTYLNACGLGWNQLMPYDFRRMSQELYWQDARGKPFSADEFWKEQLAHAQPLLPIRMDQLTKLAPLSAMLGTEFESRWTGSSHVQEPHSSKSFTK